MKHYIYKTIDPDTGEYYIGRHSSKKKIDNYKGSGLWVLNHKHKNRLVKNILVYVEDFEELVKAEEQYIKENIDNSLCMNRNNKSVGWAAGELNHNTKQENKLRLSKMMSGKNNPMYGKKQSSYTKKLLSELNKGDNNGFFGKTHTDKAKEKIRNSHLGKKESKETKEKLSKLRKGKQAHCSFKGRTHSKETKEKMAASRKKYWLNKHEESLSDDQK